MSWFGVLLPVIRSPRTDSDTRSEQSQMTYDERKVDLLGYQHVQIRDWQKISHKCWSMMFKYSWIDGPGCETN